MSEKEHTSIFVQAINFPRRKLILKRITDEFHSFESVMQTHSKEWGILSSIKEALYEPIEIWQGRAAACRRFHALGVEVPEHYYGVIPKGFEIIELPACKMLVFQGNFHDNNINANDEINFYRKIDDYNPELYGFIWADEDAPKIRLAPMEYRGYIEARPIRSMFEQ